MTTFAQAIAERFAEPIIVVTIEGVGDETNGQWKFCSKIPQYAVNPDQYKPFFAEGFYPSILSSSLNPLGGIPTSGELSLELTDGVGDGTDKDVLMTQFNTDVRVLSPMSASVSQTKTSTTIGFLYDVSGFVTVNQTVVFAGGEAELIGTNITPGILYNVTRAQYGTVAETHNIRSDVFLTNPYILGRRMKMFIGFDEPGFTEAEEKEISANWFIDTIELTQGTSTWIVQGRSQFKYLDRALNRNPLVYTATLSGASIEALTFVPQENEVRTIVPATIAVDLWGDRMYLQIDGKEIVGLDPSLLTLHSQASLNQGLIRGLGGTRGDDDIADGAEFRQVFLADSDEDLGSFRYQLPNVETNFRTTGTWISSDHPVPILLNIMTSNSKSRFPDNWVSGKGNFSSLPAGVGLGIPASEIDFDSFYEVWQRTSGWRLRNFVLGEPTNARDFLEENLFLVTGYSMTTQDGKYRLSKNRIPCKGQGISVTWDETVIMTDEDSEGHRIPMFTPRLGTDLTASSVKFTTLRHDGGTVTSIFNDITFPEIFGNSDGFYQLDNGTIDIPALSVRSTSSLPEVVRQRAIQLLFRYRRPLWVIDIATDLSQEAVQPGDLVKITHPDMPDLTTGTRGVTDMVAEVLSKEITVNEGTQQISWQVAVVTSVSDCGFICPSAVIVSTAINGSNYDVTVATNRYTDPDSDLFADLDDDDEEAFRVGDRVELRDRSGVTIVTAPTFQTVTAISAGIVQIDGNFGGSGGFAAGNVLEYTNADDSAAQQTDDYVYLADDTDFDVGSNVRTAWVYGEP